MAVKVRALPEDGAANAAVCKVVAQWLGVSKSTVSLATGAKSRNKTLLIEGEPRDLMRLIAAAAALLETEKKTAGTD